MPYGKTPRQLQVENGLPDGEPAPADDIVMADAAPPTADDDEADGDEDEVCGAPVGNGTCILEAGHPGNHRLNPPDGE